MAIKKPDPQYSEFCELIWKLLPYRKHVAGRERVFDAISACVQEWPDSEFADACANKPKNIPSLVRYLTKTVKRSLHLLYGDRDFGFIWTVLLQIILHEIIMLILEWWRKRPANRMLMRKWQHEWAVCSDSEE